MENTPSQKKKKKKNLSKRWIPIKIQKKVQKNHTKGIPKIHLAVLMLNSWALFVMDTVKSLIELATQNLLHLLGEMASMKRYQLLAPFEPDLWFIE